MNLIYIGNLVNSHGLKGEARIMSNFKQKDLVFKVGNKLYIKDKEYIIKSYRKHKMFDMVMLDGIDSIESLLPLKGSRVYFNREDLNYDGILDMDIIGLTVISNNKQYGDVIDIIKTGIKECLVIGGAKRFMIPYVSDLIEKIDLDNNKIYIKYVKGLFNED